MILIYRVRKWILAVTHTAFTCSKYTAVPVMEITVNVQSDFWFGRGEYGFMPVKRHELEYTQDFHKAHLSAKFDFILKWLH